MRAGGGALVMAAPPCSSWCRVSRGSTWRTTMNPLGLNYDFVQEANICIGRFLVPSTGPDFCPRLVAIFLVVTAANACWVMEQPSGSSDCLPFHPRMDWFFNEVVYVAGLKALGIYACHRHSGATSGWVFMVQSAQSGQRFGAATGISFRSWP